MKQDLMIYHGSQQIVEVPKFGIGKKYNSQFHISVAIDIRRIKLQRGGRSNRCLEISKEILYSV